MTESTRHEELVAIERRHAYTEAIIGSSCGGSRNNASVGPYSINRATAVAVLKKEHCVLVAPKIGTVFLLSKVALPRLPCCSIMDRRPDSSEMDVTRLHRGAQAGRLRCGTNLCRDTSKHFAKTFTKQVPSA